ncbi:MAG: V-type ATP synthase subunit F [Clostridiales bacterium]|nr:V-type ATP synthase subunit F [Clostridiales bacterium]
MKGKMAIIGDGDSVLAFTACGVDAYSVENFVDAEETLKKLAKEYQIIFITDVIAKEIDAVIKRYTSSTFPIILSLPSKEGSNGYGMDGIKSAMEKALGVDILFGDHNQGNEGD